MADHVVPAKAWTPGREDRRRFSRPGAPGFAGATIVALLLAASASAQVDRPEYVRALAAGYKASFLCSDIFTAGQSEEQVAKDDLKRIYPELEPLIPGLKATIDREARTVSVAFDDNLPPRIAAWRPHLGCAQLPIGAGPESLRLLPRLAANPAVDRNDPMPWPNGDRNATARPRGDSKALTRAVAAAFDRRTYGQGSETTAVLVVQDGKIVAERYRDDFHMHMSQRTWSVAKSLAGTLVGAAVHQGRLDVAAPAPVPEWRSPGDPRSAIATDHLLRMASGLHSDSAGNRTDATYFGGSSVAENATQWPLETAPGTRFRYANNDILLAIRGLRARLGDGERALAFPFEALLWKIGMTRTVPETDWQGNFILSSQVWTTARDLARLGLLYQNDGVWNGERILPAGWGAYVSRRGPAQPASGYGYGATFWTFPADAGIAADAYVAQGNRGQYLAIVPSRRIVVVRRGYDGPGTGFDPGPFVRDVLAALR
ncbi:MAG TPA: serine hydrolase [Allosphingosinicella sp.]|jgi:CubicO group peptidase (beta-lactamase class C family)|nr:serine hydrolase [Allosphingosinicella sp.]